MERDHTMTNIREGADVLAADGGALGKVASVEGDTIVVRKGLFFPTDYAIPMSAVGSVDGENVYLNVTGEQAMAGEWGQGGAVTSSTGHPDQDRAHGAGAGTGTGTGMEIDPEPFDHAQDTQATHINADEDLQVPVVEEDLTARTREVERGEVRIHKNVVEQQQTLDVPVTEEEVEVTRRHVNRPVTDADRAFEEATLNVPIRGEEVDVERRARVVEEIDVDKTARTRTERVSDTVRREEVHVDGDNIDIERTDPRDRNREVL